MRQSCRFIIAVYAAFAVLAIGFAIAAEPKPKQVLTGIIEEAHDGDTFTVKVDHQDYRVEVRLFGVDAPELDQAHGKEAQRFTDSLVRQRVTLSVKGNSFHRIVASAVVHFPAVGVVKAEDIDLGEWLVASGLAWQEPRFSKDKSIAFVQEQARKAKCGLWGDKAPLEPWVHRSNKKQKAKSKAR